MTGGSPHVLASGADGVVADLRLPVSGTFAL
jgi:hypothetical protein